MKNILFLVMLFLLAGCTKGLDRTFESADLGEMLSESSAQEVEIVKSYVGELVLAQFSQMIGVASANGNEIDAKMTGRQYISNAISARLNKAEVDFNDRKKISDEVRKVKLDNARYDHANGPTFAVDVFNESSIPIHIVSVHIQLHLNGKNEPAAESTRYHIFENGLESGQKSTIYFKDDFMSGWGEDWHKLSVVKAVDPEIRYEIESIEDYDNKKLSLISAEDAEKAQSDIAKLKADLSVISGK